MGLETTSFLSGLDGTWPTGIDKVNEGDDHLRLLKNVLKSQFPGIGGSGFAQAITANEMELNYSVGVTSLIQTQLDAIQSDVDANEAASDISNAALTLGVNPIGAIIMFNAAFTGIPANWQLCDGTNGTPNMVDQFVYGTNTEVELLDAGGQADAIIPLHTHPITDKSHVHTIPSRDENHNSGPTNAGTSLGANSNAPTTNLAFTGITTTDGAAGGEAVTNKNLPPYIKLAFIQRIT